MADVHLRYLNEVHCKIIAEPSIVMELSDHFTYFADNYKFSPKYKAKFWDGKIRLVNTLSGVVYAGLSQQIKKFCDARGYSFSFDPELYHSDVSEYELNEFITSLNLPMAPRDYQVKSLLKCVRSNRRLVLSPTGSGKSLLIYMLLRWYSKKTLLIVPTINLVNQMASDFREYGYTGTIHASTDGLSKSENIDCDICITTWQSLNNGKTKKPKSWYDQFEVVIGDEAHGMKADSLIQILSSLDRCKYRFGTTGTLGSNILNQITIEGLFGPQYKATSTTELMEQNHLSKLKIKCIVLKYPPELCKLMKTKTYHEEIEFLAKCEARNKFIANLTLSLSGNKLIFFKMIEHGKILYDLISSKSPDNTFYIDGSVKGIDREAIRKAIEEEHNANLLGSLGTVHGC